jgi:hypothetical protein
MLLKKLRDQQRRINNKIKNLTKALEHDIDLPQADDCAR